MANPAVEENEKVSVEKRVPFSVVEAYKTIRTNLLFVLAQSNRKCVTFSSAGPAEGKSTTSVNVAIAFSQLGIKVLLIDGDLRKPTVYKKMKLSNKVGLSSVLAGFSTFDNAVISVNKSLDVLTSGPLPPNPSEILSSSAMEILLDDLEEKYDYIIIDTPPINIVSDALVVAQKTSGIVMVVKENFTTYEDVKKALSAIELTNVKLLGSVINDAGAYETKNYNKYGKNNSYRNRKKYGRYYSDYNYNYSSEKEQDEN